MGYCFVAHAETARDAVKIVSIFKRKANNMGYCFVANAETARDAVEDSIEISKFESNETIFKH